jgi:putative sterol carrier protein
MDQGNNRERNGEGNKRQRREVRRGPRRQARVQKLPRTPQGDAHEVQERGCEGLGAVCQFEIGEAEDFTAHIDISNGSCTYADGPSEKPDVTVNSPADVWLSVSRGETSGQAAFMSGKYKAEGDLSLLMKLGSLFRP